MRKIIPILIALVAFMGSVAAQSSEKPDFKASCPSGQVLYYKIVDDGEVHLWFNNEAPELLGGHITVPRTVKYQGHKYVVSGVGDGAFANCIRIQGIELPTTVLSIGSKGFYRCTALRVVQLPKSLTTIGSQAFEGCTSLIDVVIPNSVVELGEEVFKDCSSIRHFVLSRALTEIPDGAFQGCSSVTDYIIPEQVTRFGCHAFDGHEKLVYMTFLGSVPPEPACGEPFSREVTLYVASRLFDAYKASTEWGQYPIKVL